MSPHAKIAKAAIEHLVRYHCLPPLPPFLPAELAVSRACYVHILQKPGRRLRAAWGHPLPQQPSLALEIMHHISTIFTSPCHRPLRRADLVSLIYSIIVLEPPQRISAISQLNPQHFGLYLRSDHGKTAVMLPGRLGIDTSHDQVATALREAGINPRAEAVTMYRFAVNRYE
jgi:AMMECR1 domain-containing protein